MMLKRQLCFSSWWMYSCPFVTVSDTSLAESRDRSNYPVLFKDLKWLVRAPCQRALTLYRFSTPLCVISLSALSVVAPCCERLASKDASRPHNFSLPWSWVTCLGHDCQTLCCLLVLGSGCWVSRSFGARLKSCSLCQRVCHQTLLSSMCSIVRRKLSRAGETSWSASITRSMCTIVSVGHKSEPLVADSDYPQSNALCCYSWFCSWPFSVRLYLLWTLVSRPYSHLAVDYDR